MAKTPIIKIPVDDSAFKAFLEAFQGYSDRVDELPEAWQKLNEELSKGGKASESSVKAFNDMLSSVSESAHKLKQATSEQKKLGDQTSRSAKAMHLLAKSAKDVAHSIFGIGKFLMKLGGLGIGLFGGAVFGMSELAESAYKQRRSALGNNISAGMQSAFRINMGYFVNPDMPSLVASAQKTWADQYKLQNVLHGHIYGNPALLSLRAILSAKRFIAQHSQDPPPVLMALMRAEGYGAFGLDTVHAINRLKNTPMAQLQQAERTTLAQAPLQSIGHYGYPNLLRQFRNNMADLRASLMRALAPLIPAFDQASQAITRFAVSVLGSPATRGLIKKAGEYLGSPRFLNDVQRFGAALGEVSEGLIHFVEKFTWLFGKPSLKYRIETKSTKDLLGMEASLEKKKSVLDARMKEEQRLNQKYQLDPHMLAHTRYELISGPNSVEKTLDMIHRTLKRRDAYELHRGKSKSPKPHNLSKSVLNASG